jgi:predicted nicotinamide N-methyase
MQKKRKIYKALVDNTVIKCITIKNFKFYVECVDDSEKLLNVISDNDFKKDDSLPYWAELWPSAIALAEYLLENRDQFTNQKVLELGCGVGLGGISAQACGAQIVFSDYEAPALHFAQKNFRRNFSHSAQVILLDWQKFQLKQSFNVVIGADILYENRSFIPIINILSQVLMPGGVVILAEPNRNIAQEFFKQILRNGWSDTSLLKSVELDHKLHRVTIHRILKC